MEQKGLDMLQPKKKVVEITIDCFKNKETGEYAYEKMGEFYEDGTGHFKVFDGRCWKLISSTKIGMGTLLETEATKN